LVLAVIALASALNAPPGTRVTSLPGFNGALPEMHSGYVTVDEQAGRAIFYVLVSATGVDPTTAPLVFWYQGGPGCSGLGGMLTENGPLVPNTQGGLSVNPISWTSIANIVYLEQPAFVGWSYSNTSSDRNTGDARATADNVRFINGFLDLYPDFAGRDTWFTGESYGGFYVPSLTAALLADSSSQIYKQLQGFMIGNPVMFCGTMQNITVQINGYYWHGLVSYTNFNAWYSNGCVENQNSNTCQQIWNATQAQIGVIDQELKRKRGVPIQPSLDPDDLYQDFCTGNGTLNYVATIPVNCTALGDLVSNYLNRADVQQAFHARGPNGGPPLQWTECTSAINYTISGNSLVPLYAKFQQQKPGLKVLVYSGDVDIATVPFFYTQPCLGELNAQNTVTWGPWYVNGQTAGYWEQFEQPAYIFATIKGAGHEAPQYQPLAAFNLFSRYMASQSLTDPSQSERKYRHEFHKVRRQGDVLRDMLKETGAM